MTTTSTPGCRACSPALGAPVGYELPPAWQPFVVPAHWGLAQALRAQLSALWCCRECGTHWTAGYDQYHACHDRPQALSGAAISALMAPAGPAAVRHLLASDAPRFWFAALLDGDEPVLALDKTMRRRLARRAGVEPPDRPKARRGPRLRDATSMSQAVDFATDVLELELGKVAPDARRVGTVFALLQSLDRSGKPVRGDRALRAQLVRLLEQLIEDPKFPRELRDQAQGWVARHGHRQRD